LWVRGDYLFEQTDGAFVLVLGLGEFQRRPHSE
jgi:hypothetical protein